MLKWIAIIDNRTCSGCLAMNGKVLTKEEFSKIDLDKIHKIDLRDPEFKCRCYVEPVD